MKSKMDSTFESKFGIETSTKRTKYGDREA